jgi:hypothetical protein
MKQTAVEWLAEQITTVKWKMSDVTDRNSIIEQAKAMEKEQIIEAHKTATLEAGFEHSADDWANQYYNQTYKSTADESQTDRTIQS